MKNIITSFIISVVVVVGFANLYPLFKNDNLGATLTTLNSSDNLVDFPTTYNANNTAINTELGLISGTTTIPSITTLTGLTTIGTIGTGVWEATDVGVAHGGTGKSAWTQYLIPYADTTTSFSQIAIGTSGQFLTSGGAGVAPSFTTSAINQALDYSFTGTYFGIDNLYASSTLNIAGVDYTFPSTDGASSTVFMTDGAGAMTSYRPDWHLLDVVETTAVDNATSTFATAENLMLVYSWTACATGCNARVTFNGLSDGNYGSHISVDNGAFTDASDVDFMTTSNSGGTAATQGVVYIKNVSSQRKLATFSGSTFAGGSTAPSDSAEGSGVWDNTSAQITSLNIESSDTVGRNFTNLKIYVYGTNN